MKKTKPFLIVLFFLSASIIYASEKIDAQFFNQVDAFYKKNVKSGLIDYKQLKENDGELILLIKIIEEVDLSDENSSTKQAFYINAYNLIVIQSVLEAYPIASVQEINGFFDSKKHLIGGKKMTLNDLEKNELIKIYKDARFHFVLVCGAIGCPPITNFAYTPDKLENQLEMQTKKAMNNPDFIHASDDKVELSEIFKWYANDFGGSKTKVMDFINKYRTDKIAADNSIGYYTYDWNLNVATIKLVRRKK